MSADNFFLITYHLFTSENTANYLLLRFLVLLLSLAEFIHPAKFLWNNAELFIGTSYNP